MVAWQARPGWRRAVVLAGTWTLGDLARQFVLTGFPWNPWGSVWAFPGAVGDLFLQPVAWIGTPGLTLATVLLATLPTLGRRGWAAGMAGILVWAGLGAWRLSRPAGAAPDLLVVLVQGDVQEAMKWDRSVAEATFRRYLDLTAAGVARAGGGPKIVVWPEGASPFLLESDSMARLAVAEAANGGGTGPVPALIGTIRLEGGRLSTGEHPRNSLVAITGSGAVAGTYDKWHLVPGGEYQPSWVPLPVQLVPGGGFEPGPGPRTLHVPGLPPVGALICYEAIFPGQGVDEADRPDWLVNVTNDAWFGESTGPRQHLEAARMRAVEEGLPLLRAANTGISAGFDAHGRELARLGLDQEGTLLVRLPGKLPPTPFAIVGLMIPALMAGVVAALGVRPNRRRAS
jgi:apolipoprotein N-acyltransferase